MDSVERNAKPSNETGRRTTDFESWAEQFRNSLKEKELNVKQAAVMEREKTTNNYNKLLFIVMLLAGLTLVTLSLLRML